MNILFVVPYTPTPIRTRPYNLLRTLACRGHSVTLATLWETEQERTALKRLEDEGIRILAERLTKPRSAWNCLRAILTAVPLQAVYCWQPTLAASIKSTISRQKYDVIHVEHLRGARYCLRPPISGLQSPIVWDSVDCISYLFEQAAHNSRSPFGRLATRFELPRTKKYEAWLAKQFDRVLVTSPIDAAALQALVSRPGLPEGGHVQYTSHNQPISSLQSHMGASQPLISVLPNGVDLEYFSSSDTPREPSTIVFSGKMSYHANVTAAFHLVHDIMPFVWVHYPNARVQIVGKDPPAALRELGTQGAKHRVQVTGTVSDIRPFLRRATLAAVSLVYGAGSQFKVLEAMATKTPVVATRRATGSLCVAEGQDVLVADEPAAFARQIVRLLDDRELQLRIGLAGRRYVEQHHDWNQIVERLENIYRETINYRRSTAI